MLKEVLIFPTDTVYGIGASIYDKVSIDKIYELKGRDFNKPLAVLVSSINDIEEIAIFDNRLLALSKAFWPGALTVILKTNEKYKSISKEDTIGVRIPNHDVALNLIRKYGPLKTTSVNKSGELPLNDYNVIKDRYGSYVSIIFDNKIKQTLVSSTVVDLTNDNLEILREGDITLLDIQKVLK